MEVLDTLVHLRIHMSVAGCLSIVASPAVAERAVLRVRARVPNFPTSGVRSYFVPTPNDGSTFC